MHVVLNALSITNRSGTGRYAWGLINGFMEQAFNELRLSVIIPSDFIIPPTWRSANTIRFYSIPAERNASRIFWEQFRMPQFIRKIQADLLHSPAFIAPIVKRVDVPQVVTIHDLTYLRYPHTIPKQRLRYYHWAIPRSMRRAHTIITDSRAVAHEIEELLHQPEHIVPIHLGVDLTQFSPEDDGSDRQILESSGMQPPYFLFVGTREPRKNLETLLKAYRRAYDQGLRIDLVLVGRLGWMQRPEDFEHPGIKAVGFVPEHHLPAIYRHALALMAPSWYEGFDLPLQEALASGTPVIASDTPVHQEVMGDRARYCIVDDPEDWAQAMIEASSRPKPKVPDRVRDWSDVATETFMVYLSVTGAG